MKILIIRLEHHTEVFFTTAMLRVLRNAYPNSKLHFLVKREYSAQILLNKQLDRVFDFEGDLRDTVLDLLGEKYDIIIDLQRNLRSANVIAMLTQAFNADIKVYKLNKMLLREKLLLFFGLNFLPDTHIVDRYFRTIRKFGIVNDSLGLEFEIPDEEKIKNEDLPMSHSAGYISFVLSNPTFGLSQSDWLELCSEIDYPIILQGSNDCAALANEISKIDPIRIYNSCGKFSFNEQVDIIRYAKVVVGVESYLIHTAASFKRSMITIIENKRALMGYFPYFGFNNLKSTVSPDITIVKVKSVQNISKEIKMNELCDAVKKQLSR